MVTDPHNLTSLQQMERFILKLNSHAIEFMKHKDGHKLELAREFLGRAEATLLNTD